MKGNPEVIEYLKECLKGELSAISQYFLHAEICRDWGYSKLYEYIKKESIDEMRHAEALIERILFLNAMIRFMREADVTRDAALGPKRRLAGG